MTIPNFFSFYELALLYLQNDKSLFTTKQQINLMNFAIEVRWISLITTLYSDGIGFSMINDDNETILFSAIRNNYPVFINIAIANGYDLNVINKDGDSLLHTCIKSNKLYIAETLLMTTMNYNVVNKKGLTPLSLLESGIIPSTSPNFYSVLNILNVKVFNLVF